MNHTEFFAIICSEFLMLLIGYVIGIGDRPAAHTLVTSLEPEWAYNITLPTADWQRDASKALDMFMWQVNERRFRLYIDDDGTRVTLRAESCMLVGVTR